MGELIKKTSRRSLLWMGILIIGIGKLWLLYKLNIIALPWWLFTWKTVLILIGIIIGISSKFRGFPWIEMVVIGFIFMLTDIPGFGNDFEPYLWPVLIMVIGLFIVLKALFRKSMRSDSCWDSDGVITSTSNEDVLDLTSIFGGHKRKIFSKNFKGGELVSVFGGAEIDLSQADINGVVHLETTNVFGGVKLVIPANWELRSEMTSIMGGSDDKRNIETGQDGSKVLVLTGFNMFGGVDVRSY